MTVREIRRLLWGLVLFVQETAEKVLHWSNFRRSHQAVAKYYHYKKRCTSNPFCEASPL
jgi:hypothetical protein